MLILLAANAWADKGDFIVGAGIEADNADGLAVAVIGEVAIADSTWLSGGVARNTVDLPFDLELETLYADVGIDHLFDPMGIRAGVAYWGDPDILDSLDWLVSAYFQGDRGSVAIDYEYRDFEFDLPSTNLSPGRRATFDANGWGASMRVDLGKSADISVGGITYDYSVDLRLDSNRDILGLLSVSRLSLINSLVDYRAYAAFGIDAGESRWALDFARWRGAIDGSDTNSLTLRLVTPIGKSGDIELGLGVDDSDLYGNVTFLSLFLYFYGGPS